MLCLAAMGWWADILGSVCVCVCVQDGFLAPFRTFVAPVIGCYMPAKPDDAPVVLEEALADQDSDLGAYLLAHLQT